MPNPLTNSPCGNPIASIETTHGRIRLQSEAPFVFLSDRLGQFNEEATIQNPYRQNFVAAHSVGIVAAWSI